jgi:hypothetical protein
VATEEQKRQARARRRTTEESVKHRATPNLTALSTLEDPTAYLEALRKPIIDRMLEIADATVDDALEARILHDLLRMSSMGRARLDVTAHTGTDPALVDAVARLSQDQLERLARGDPLLALEDGDGRVVSVDG